MDIIRYFKHADGTAGRAHFIVIEGADPAHPMAAERGDSYFVTSTRAVVPGAVLFTGPYDDRWPGDIPAEEGWQEVTWAEVQEHYPEDAPAIAVDVEAMRAEFARQVAEQRQDGEHRNATD